MDRFKNIVFDRGVVLWVIAIILIISSFFEFTTPDSMDREVAKLETLIQRRQDILEDYSLQTLNSPKDTFITFDNFPEDMVIYRYFNDTIHSWINQLPISNDEIDRFSFGYRLNHLTSRVVSNTPLAYLVIEEQFVNLGSAWYIVNVYTLENQVVISALLVKTDYSADNSTLENKINPNFYLRRQLSIAPIAFDESYIVRGKDGRALFSVLKNLPHKDIGTGVILRWIASVLILLSLFISMLRERALKRFLFFLGGLWLFRYLAFLQSKTLQGEHMLFSPTLYADANIFNSLSDLIINNFVITLVVLAFFVVRRRFAILGYRYQKLLRPLLFLFFLLIPLLLIPYIHITLKSIIYNSSIVLELYKIDEISVYSIIVYLSYSLLFLSLLLSLQLMRPFVPSRFRRSFLKGKVLTAYLVIISIYTLVIISYFGFDKEFNKNRVWTTKLSIERDLNLELQLRNLEKFIENDPLGMWFTLDGNLERLNTRLTESYFWNIIQRYDLRPTICKPNDFLHAEITNPQATPIHCNTFYENEIYRYGSKIAENSKFYFLNNYNGRISYIGVFPFLYMGEEIRLYLELDSKFLREAVGYSDLLMDSKMGENFNIPTGYSYGKFLNNKLVSYGGRYNYPLVFNGEFESGYRLFRSDGYVHFINKISDENIIIISRQEIGTFPFFVSFSYLLLFYSFIILGLIRLRNRDYFYKLPRNSFRWKITVLVISSLVIALLALGTGSVWFSIRYFEETNRESMEEKLNSAQNALSYYSKFAQKHNDPGFNNLKLIDAMNRLSNTAQVDINIYGADGLLLRTTRGEIFDRYLMGSRMNHVAFQQIAFNNKKQFINREKIGNLTYYSLYAPLFNLDGKLIAIVNIPYFSRQADFRKDASSIIATIINIYLLLLIGALFGGVALANSITRPLGEIVKKMQLIDISQQPEHIDYNNRDELGILVAAYNKMVDDLNESTSRLAQSEREQAWREMARQIAHEIKNPLTPMRLSIQHLVRLKERGIPEWQTKFDELAKSLIEQIDILSEAAGEFSSFSRFYTEKSSSFDLIRLIKEQIILFNTRDNINLSLKTDYTDAIVYTKKTQITRVLVNLISNAVQAIEHKERGYIIVELYKEEDKMFVISVHDSGEGVPENLVHKLFKPNFTTKSGGTGLGLAICRSIMEQSQGSATYSRSTLLGGACFTIKIAISYEEKSV